MGKRFLLHMWRNIDGEFNVDRPLKTSKGFEFQKVEGGWKDLATQLIWFEEIKTDINQYDAEKWAAEQGKRLPKREEFEAAELHGIRELPMKWEGFWFWSTTVYLGYSAFAYGFIGDNGIFGSYYRGYSYDFYAARLVSESNSSTSEIAGGPSSDADKIKKARELLKQALEVLVE